MNSEIWEHDDIHSQMIPKLFCPTFLQSFTDNILFIWTDFKVVVI